MAPALFAEASACVAHVGPIPDRFEVTAFVAGEVGSMGVPYPAEVALAGALVPTHALIQRD